MNTLLNNKKIAIIGGGPGGLTLAKLLQLKGIAVNVYERDKDKSVRQQGATLDLHDDSGLKALREAGLFEEFKKLYRPGADKTRITNNQAEIQYDDHVRKEHQEFGQPGFRPEIDRGPLRDMLITSLAEGTIIWDSKFKEMKKQGDGWQLYFENGTTSYADIVIAADGGNSKVRPYINNIKPIYSGNTVIEGNIYHAAKNAPMLWELAKGGKVFAFGNSKSIVLSVKGDGSLSFYTGTHETEDWAKNSGIDFENKQQVFDWFKTRFAEWSTAWHEIFETDESYFVLRPQYYFPLNQSWTALPNLTMIGDAAHLMPPYAGEGVNQAMQDALELYEELCLNNHSSVHEAIATFEKKMCTRATEIAQGTLENMEMMHSEDSLEQMVNFFSQVGVQQ